MKPEEFLGKSFLFVESEDIVDAYFPYMRDTIGLHVLGRTSVPDELHTYLLERNVEYSAIHPQANYEVDFVVDAIQKGDKILVIRPNRGYKDRDKKFAVFDKLGIATFEKRWPGYSPQVIIAALAAKY